MEWGQIPNVDCYVTLENAAPFTISEWDYCVFADKHAYVFENNLAVQIFGIANDCIKEGPFLEIKMSPNIQKVTRRVANF